MWLVGWLIVVRHEILKTLSFIEIRGVMGVPYDTDDDQGVSPRKPGSSQEIHFWANCRRWSTTQNTQRDGRVDHVRVAHLYPTGSTVVFSL